jgi:hypothetical protein
MDQQAGRDSAVGIATRYGMRFSVPFQTGPGAYPASCTMGTGSFLWVKRSGSGADHPPHLIAEVKKEYGIPLLPLWNFMACYGSTFTFKLETKY